ncbi:Maf family nucleotide pyrophosphatase [Alishewanella sp. 16-MA]|uniref:7-methyl-GTP pyrophosphatase n=1 Tax=Alishewanella maricola TaxID=2795740 RepID=A0ABS8C0M9_9ALTE|nr:Maf family nucleotide pyrophosphatase [Alishewanella maricola]
MTIAERPSLYLASTSPYRRALLSKLTENFQCIAPNTIETPRVGESAEALVQRLATEKAHAVASTLTSGLVIGSDQVAVFGKDIIGKPHTEEKAYAQLRQFSGQAVQFLTGLAVVNAATGETQTTLDSFKVHFRTLTEAEIRCYVAREQPLDCAGSFKSEGLGICLFSKLAGDDPNSLIGLPLIKLLQLLRQAGRDLLLEP